MAQVEWNAVADMAIAREPVDTLFNNEGFLCGSKREA